MKWPAVENSMDSMDGGMPLNVRPNPALFHELKQKFPEVPDSVVTSCLQQNGNNKQKCLNNLEIESQKYLYGDPCLGDGAVDTRTTQLVHELSLNNEIRDRSGSTSSTASVSSIHSGHNGRTTPHIITPDNRRGNAASPVVAHESPGCPLYIDSRIHAASPLQHSVPDRSVTSSPLTHYDNWIPGPSSASGSIHPDYRMQHSTSSYHGMTQSHPNRVIHSNSSPDVVHKAQAMNNQNTTAGLPPQSAPVMTNTFNPFSTHNTNYPNYPYGHQVSAAPFSSMAPTPLEIYPHVSPSAGGYTAWAAAPKGTGTSTRPDQFNQQYSSPPREVAMASPHSTLSPGDIPHLTSPYSSPRTGFSQYPSHMPLNVDVTMGGGNQKNAVHYTPRPHQHPPLSINIQSKQRPSGQLSNFSLSANSSGSTTPVSGCCTPTQLFPPGTGSAYPLPSGQFSRGQYQMTSPGHYTQLTGGHLLYPTYEEVPQDDMPYVQALISHQKARLEKICQDLEPQCAILPRLCHEVSELGRQIVLHQPHSRRCTISLDDLMKVSEENQKLQSEIQKMTTELDRYNYGSTPLGIVDPLEQQSFYQTFESMGQQGPSLPPHNQGSHRDSGCITDRPPRPPPPLPPRQNRGSASDLDECERQWPCSACTFLNHPAVDKCEMCEMPRMPVSTVAPHPPSCYCHKH